ncbi:exopolyphosphatase [Desulfobacterales bacterium HSG16]|nr:exopolyphosphatase [Desulfobacterales bacterium HSG16]
MRIVTRPDFDGVICAVFLSDTNEITHPTLWVEPSKLQKGLVDIRNGDIIANLPWHRESSLWFDHHYTNMITQPFEGVYKQAPSAAGLIFDYYQNRLKQTAHYEQLSESADKIDSADLSHDEILHPENYTDVLLSMTISGSDRSDEPYWNRLVDLLRQDSLEQIINEPDVNKKCRIVNEQNMIFKKLVYEYTTMQKAVSVTDFRPVTPAPSGNRFLVYALFPEAVANVRIRYHQSDDTKVIISVGHSIVNRRCRVNAGKMLSVFEGGGHPGAASCAVPRQDADRVIRIIIDKLQKNDSDS